MVELQLFLAFVAALSITALLIPLLERAGPVIGLIDNPGPRKVHSVAVPRVGGIAIAAGIVAPLLLALEPAPQLVGILAGLMVLLAFGVWDDRAPLGYRAKFAGQIMAALICIVLGDVRIDSITLDARHSLPEPLSLAVTLLFMVGVTNAVNLSDGLDGLAGGMALLCCVAIALLGGTRGGLLVTTMALAAAGAVLGFLRYNTHPARIFMGDAGSQVLGFTMGVLAILVTQGEGTAVSAGLPLLLIGMPILDTLAVMVRRLRERRSPFSPDRYHLHHRLLGLGLRHSEAVATVYLLQGVLFMAAYLLRFASDLVISFAFALHAAAVLLPLRWAERSGWRLRAGAYASPLARFADRLRSTLPLAAISGAAGAIALGLLAGYVGSAAFAATGIARDLAMLCAVLFVLQLASLLRSGATAGSIDRLVTYVTALLMVYLDQTGQAREWLPQQAWLLLAAAAVSASVAAGFDVERRFELTTLDLLVVLLSIVALLLPALLPVSPLLSAGIVKAVLLLYVVEMAFSRRSSTRLMQGLLVAGLAIVGAHSVLAPLA